MNAKPSKITAVITGAYGGIGRAVCKELAHRGANLYIVGRRQDALNALHAELKIMLSPTQHIHSFVADLGDPLQIEKLGRELNTLSPKINTLINNAGINHFALFEDTPDDRLQQMLNINVLAQIRVTKALLPRLKEQNCARIVNVGSVFGALGHPGFSAYCASKFGLRGFSESLSRELSDTSVTVGHFVARATDTPMNRDSVAELNQALKTKVDSPESVAKKLVQFVASDALYNRIAWPEKLFVRINAIAPAIVSRVLAKNLSTIKHHAKSN